MNYLSCGFAKQQLLVGVLIVLAIAAAVIAVVLNDPLAEEGNRLGNEFTYDITELRKIDPALIGYKEAAEITTGLPDLKAIAAGPGDTIYVAGKNEVRIYSSAGSLAATFPVADSPTCLAVSEDKTIYIGFADHIEVYSAEGSLKNTWDTPQGTPHITCITAAGADVFAADAGNREILHYDLAGTLIKKFGKKDPALHNPGLLVPSPYFDIQMAPDGLLRAVNPGRFRIEAYTLDGGLEIWWGGRSDTRIEAFCGCCNPSHFTILPDNSFVTSEKGLPRVKLYDAQGEFQCVVAGPDSFENSRKPHDIAADSSGRILVLDPARQSVRIFTLKNESN